MTYNSPEILEKYKVPENITFKTLGIYLKKILNDYAKGALSLSDVLNHGESLNSFIYNKFIDPENPEYPEFPQTDLRSIPLNVLEYLESTAFFIIPRDVPYFIEFLDTKAGHEKEGWEKFQSYIKSQTLRKRINEEMKQGVGYRKNHGFDLDKPFEPL